MRSWCGWKIPPGFRQFYDRLNTNCANRVSLKNNIVRLEIACQDENHYKRHRKLDRKMCF